MQFLKSLGHSLAIHLLQVKSTLQQKLSKQFRSFTACGKYRNSCTLGLFKVGFSLCATVSVLDEAGGLFIFLCEYYFTVRLLL